MVTITDSAKNELKRILQTKNLDSGKFLRLATPPIWQGEGDFGVVVDSQRFGDHKVDHEGLTIILIDPGMVEQLPNAVFDFKDSPQGQIFTLDVY